MQQTRTQPSASVDTALALIRQRRWPEALQLLAQLAQGGNVRAMEIAGKVSMLHHDVAGATGWFRRALAAGETAGRLCDMANALSAAGAYDQALEYYHRAIACDPNLAGPHCHLGRMLLAGGELEAAAAELRQAVAADAGYVQAYISLGEALLGCGDGAGAKTALEQALALDEKNGGALFLLSAAEEKLGHTERALNVGQQALECDPENVRALGHMGAMLFRMGLPDAALEYFRKLLVMMPGSGRAHNNCGLALLKIGREEEAIAHVRKALTGPDAYAGAAINLGEVLFLSGDVNEALSLFKTATKEMPENPQAFAGLADVEQAMGNPEAAYQAFLHTIDLSPENPAAYRRLVSLGAEWPIPEDRLAHLRAMEAHEADMSDTDRSELHFALCRVAERDGNDAEAARHMLAANAAHRRAFDYDEARELQVLEQLMAATPATLFQEKASLGEMSDVPIFIVGMPRSGTTLLEQILASHPDVYGLGELPDFGEIIGCHSRNQMPDVDLTRLSGKDMKTLGGRYLQRIRKFSPDARRMVDKQPWNYMLAGYIHLLLPGAKILHIHRDPMDTCLSCYEQVFRGTLDFCYDQGELGRYYRAYEKVMAHWYDVLPEGTICDVSYEDLVGNLEPEVRRILEYCGLAWDPACLNFYESKRAVRTASVMQVRQPIYQASVGRWKRYRQALAPLQQALGLSDADMG